MRPTGGKNMSRPKNGRILPPSRDNSNVGGPIFDFIISFQTFIIMENREYDKIVKIGENPRKLQNIL